MKKLVLLFVLSLTVGCVYADNFMQTTNPFPQSNMQTINNIYESEPCVMQEEQKQAKKSWFRKGKNLQEQETQDAKRGIKTYPTEGVENGFYMFK